ncbi:MAG: ArsR family transcriptional regulator [Nitrosotalea sp.]
MMQESIVPIVQEETVSEYIINITNGNDELRSNDSKVLDALSENNSTYTFSGIMRKINMHQETLSRSLQRLSEQDLVQKSQNGYKLSKKVVLKKQTSSTRLFTPILRAYLPSDVDVTKLIDIMVGRWFKNLRWIAMVENIDEHLLQWADESGFFQINLRMVPNSIIIETNAKKNKQVMAALISASRIIEEVFKSILNLQLTPAVNFTNNVLAN